MVQGTVVVSSIVNVEVEVEVKLPPSRICELAEHMVNRVVSSQKNQRSTIVTRPQCSSILGFEN